MDDVQLAKSDGPKFDQAKFTGAAKHIHERQEFTPQMMQDEPVKALTRETYTALSAAINIGREVPPELRVALEENTFIFSGFKTYQQLREVSGLLKDEDGGFKSFEAFSRDIQQLNDRYNKNYLRAEYNYATQSTQMAVKWHDFVADGDDYLLQYRTSGDDRVRAEHAALHGVTLPIGDAFWDEYLPPLDWGCRCTVVQVPRDKYQQSDPDEAKALGEAATAGPKKKIFRFNPGKTMKIFPPKHPYYKVPAAAKPIVQQTTAADYEQQRKDAIIAELPSRYSDEVKAAIAQNCLDLEKELKKTKGTPMSHEKADKQSANPKHVQEYIPDPNGTYYDSYTKQRLKKNPLYNTTRDRKFSINCQTCAPAYALRLRGFDVTAKGNTPGSLSEYLSHQHSFEAWLNHDGTPCSAQLTSAWMAQKGYSRMTEKRYKEYFEDSCKEEGVYILTIGWKGGGGHATILQRFSDGSLKYVEPQEYNDAIGTARPIDELCMKGAATPLYTRGILRVDDKIFNLKFASIFD